LISGLIEVPAELAEYTEIKKAEYAEGGAAELAEGFPQNSRNTQK
jgi:hypothetical protein